MDRVGLRLRSLRPAGRADLFPGRERDKCRAELEAKLAALGPEDPEDENSGFGVENLGLDNLLLAYIYRRQFRYSWCREGDRVILTDLEKWCRMGSGLSNLDDLESTRRGYKPILDPRPGRQETGNYARCAEA